MAFTFDAKTEANATSTGLTVSHTTAATAELMTVGIAIRGSQTVTMTYAGVSLTQDVTGVDSTDPERCSIFSLLAPASGANNLIVSLSGSVLHFVTVATWQADSASITCEVTAENSNEGVSSQPNVTLPASTGLLAVDIASTEEAASPPFSTNGADQTVLHNTGSGSYGRGASYELSPSSAEVFNWGYGGPSVETWVHVAAVYLEGGAAVTYPTALLDISRAAFPFSPAGDWRIQGHGRAGSRRRVRATMGPSPVGGFERYIYPRLHAVYPVGGTTFDQAVDATVTTALAITNQVNKLVTASPVTTTATISRQVGKILSDTIATTTTITKQVAKAISATVTTSTTLTALRVFIRELTATVTTNATIQRMVGKPISATVTTATTITKQVGKALSDTVTTSTTLAGLRVFLREISATVTTSATMTRLLSFKLTLSATVTTATTITKQVGKFVSATVTTIADLIAQFVSGSAAEIVTTFFGRGRVRGGHGTGTPDANLFDGSPHGGSDPSRPSGDFFDDSDPRRG